MCGFVGYVENGEKKEDLIKSMADVIKHRGPDDEGIYLDNDIAIAFRRLSIIDLSNGHQPMYNEDNTMVITFNGEIYNFKELREDLEKKGHVFSNNSDTQVILHGYEEYGKEITKKLRGMYAFVIWDIKNKKLFGARDCFGIKPFYYYNENGVFIFGSEIKSFLPHPKFKKEINRKALKTYLTFQYSALEETFFEGVYRLNPGHQFEYQNGKLEITEYNEITFSEEKKKFEETVDLIHNTVTNSIDYHRISDVEVGAFLSSGVDSSYVVSYAKPDRTFTVGFNFNNFDETVYAKELSEMLGITNTSKIISGDEFFDSLEHVQYYSDEPHANLSAVPLYHLAKLARKDVKVVLSGEGADELFGGYQTYHRTNFYNAFQKLPLSLRVKLKKMALKMPDIKGKNFLINEGTPVEEGYIGQAFVFSDEAANDVLKEEYKTDISYKDITKPIFEKVKNENDIIKMQYLDMKLWLPNDILLKADKMTMASSLELRVPFLDKEVFKMASTLPKEYKVKGKDTTKYALRKSAEKIVPHEWSQREKIGFMVPFKYWLKEEKYYSKVKEVFESEYAAKFFETDKIMKLLNDYYEGKAMTHRKVYTIYSFLIWYKKYFIDIK
ncbi:MAG: asparagine synthase (glutamine-hydrolyzing) [Clostridia bacterium]|nr:asparagine synthase (glutamine-hydrolyzing) [Clostridia bacterium]